jgi:histidinol-phosphate/aromatic aminotransferase/cobyric acid decarboxylase-like protein
MTSDINFLQAYPTEANFQLIQMPSGVSSDLFANLMLIRHGIYVRSCGDKIGLDGEFLRVAIRTESENAAIIDALSNVLGTIHRT